MWTDLFLIVCKYQTLVLITLEELTAYMFLLHEGKEADGGSKPNLEEIKVLEGIEELEGDLDDYVVIGDYALDEVPV